MCAGCGIAIAVNLISKACPKDVIVACATSCLEVTTSAYPITAWKVPWIHCAFETTSALASGIEVAIKKLKKPWSILAMAGDGGTADIGIQGLSGMLERGHKVTQVCISNEAYMNTGIQRSSATPYGAWTTTSPPGKKSFGKREWRKPIEEIVAAHHIPYVASASIAYPSDLIKKIKKGFELQPSFIHIQCPCPAGWKFDVNKTIEIARLGVETGAWILYEIEYGKFRITKRLTQRKPVDEYLKLQGRFKHLSKMKIEEIQDHVNKEWRRMENMEITNQAQKSCI
jgi:pyruvate ferredoxin oxidoreductase beta subunit